MKERTQWSDQGTRLERALIGVGRHEGPSSVLEDRILASVRASFRAEQAPWWRRLCRPRPLLGLSGGALFVLLASVATVHTTRSAPSSGTPTLRAAEPKAVASPSVPPVIMETNVAALPDAPPPRAPRPTPTPRSAEPSIEREIQLLDVVKKNLRDDDKAGAARAIAAYDDEFPRGVLRPEATVLRIRTLLAQGDTRAANVLADEFLSRHPESVHGRQIRALLGRSE